MLGFRVVASLLLMALAALPAEAQRKHPIQAKVVEAEAALQAANALPKSIFEPGQKFATTISNMNVTYWDSGRVGQRPLIIFSHGFGGCATQSSFLTAELSKKGWLVIAPDHRDAGCIRNRGQELELSDASLWDETTFLQRRDDLRRLYRTLKADPTWKNRIDWSRVGLMGYGLGGYASLAVAGGMPSWKVDGFVGVLAVSPFCAPLNMKGKLGDIGVPVMFQVGAEDTNKKVVQGANGCFDRLGGNATYVEFDKAGHDGFTDFARAAHLKMAAYAGQFFETTFAGEDLKLNKMDGVSDLRQK